MNQLLWALLIFAGVGVGLWLVSFVVDALRPTPRAPVKLGWAPEIAIDTVDVGGTKLRYIKTGSGPNLVLLHTLRTQLDLFSKIVPELAKRFTVYALDYPGHGYSDIPQARYDAAFFVNAVEGFLDKLNLRDVTLAGVSIGGPIALTIAARRNPRIVRVIAVNPYDYAQGRGMARSSLLGAVITYTAIVPFLGETVMRLRNYPVMRNILEGGVADPKSIPPALLKEMYLVGNRAGHYGAFLSLLRNAASWQSVTKDYSRIDVPVLIVWGNEDWARVPEREHDNGLVPGAKAVTIGGGHFLPLDGPRELSELIVRFAGADPTKPRV